MKRRSQKQLIIVLLLLGAVVTGGVLILLRWPTSCIKLDTPVTAPEPAQETPTNG